MDAEGSESQWVGSVLRQFDPDLEQERFDSSEITRDSSWEMWKLRLSMWVSVELSSPRRWWRMSSSVKNSSF